MSTIMIGKILLAILALDILIRLIMPRQVSPLQYLWWLAKKELNKAKSEIEEKHNTEVERKSEKKHTSKPVSNDKNIENRNKFSSLHNMKRDMDPNYNPVDDNNSKE